MATDAARSPVAPSAFARPGADQDVPRPAAPAPPPAPAPSRRGGSSGWGVPLAVLIVGMFMSVLDISIINVAIPTMQRDFAGCSTTRSARAGPRRSGWRSWRWAPTCSRT
jgi:hypothetical protein